MKKLLVPFALLALLTSACGSSNEQERCATCGMIVSAESGWRAGAQGEGGDALAFDSPKCLFRYEHRHGRTTDPWVIEYYSQERRPARELLYVHGSDLESPMGRDLVPVDGREAAERLLADHAATQISSYEEVGAELVEELFGN